MCHGPHHMYRHHGMACFRQFLTTEEKIDHLKEYKHWLEQEVKGVDGPIKELQKAG